MMGSHARTLIQNQQTMIKKNQGLGGSTCSGMVGPEGQKYKIRLLIHCANQ